MQLLLSLGVVRVGPRGARTAAATAATTLKWKRRRLARAAYLRRRDKVKEYYADRRDQMLAAAKARYWGDPEPARTRARERARKKRKAVLRRRLYYKSHRVELCAKAKAAYAARTQRRAAA